MKYKSLILHCLIISAIFMLTGSDLLAVVDGGDAGMKVSADNLTKLLKGNLAPVILICGCLAGVALAFIKSSPAPFIITIVITVGFGFASSWIGSTYGVLV